MRKRKIGKDDYAMGFAWLASILFAIASWSSLHYGMGGRITEVTEAGFKKTIIVCTPATATTQCQG